MKKVLGIRCWVIGVGCWLMVTSAFAQTPSALNKKEFASDLVCSTITYWFGEQAKEQAGEQVSGHAGGQVSDQPSGQVSDQPSDQVQKVLNCIRDNVYTMNVLLKKLGISSRRYVRINMLNPAIEGGYVLRAYPDKPNHPNQRYYLSEKGLKLVK